MARRKPRAIFIGSSKVSDFLKGNLPDWEFLPPEKRLIDFERGIDSGDISDDIQVIITTDKHFDESGRNQTFENIVASMSPLCLFIVVNYDPKLKSLMQERINRVLYGLGYSDSRENYYFIQTTNFKDSIKRVERIFIEKNVNDPNSLSRGAALILDGREESEGLEEDHTEEKQSEIDKVRNTKSEYLGQVVTSTSSKGGSGKSTVAITLATLISHASIRARKDGLTDRDLKVCIVDLDVRDGQLGFFTGLTSPTLFHIVNQGVSEETVRKNTHKDDKLKIDLILAPRSPRTASNIPPEFYLELIAQLKKMYDYIILDTSVNYTDPLLEEVAYPVANLIIMVTEIVTTSVYSMVRWIHEVTQSKEKQGMGISKDKIGIVINKALSDVDMDKNKIINSAQGVPIITAIPSNQKTIAHATNINSMNKLLANRSILDSYMRLAKAVVGRRWTIVEPRIEDINEMRR